MSFDVVLLTTLLCINAIGALGFYFTFTSGQLSLAHGALYAIGGYAAGYASAVLHLPWVVALITGFAAPALIGLLVARLLARLRGLYFAVATLAFGVVAMELIKRIPGLGGPFGLGGIESYTTLWVALVVLVLVALALRQFDRSPLYVAHAAARVDQEGAVVMGIHVARTRGIAFAIGGGITGLAGALYAGFTTVITAEMGSFNHSLAFLLMVVIGGANSWRGPILGAAIWTAMPELFRSTDEWRMVLFGAAAVAIIVWRPQGIIPRRIFRPRARAGRARVPAVLPP